MNKNNKKCIMVFGLLGLLTVNSTTYASPTSNTFKNSSLKIISSSYFWFTIIGGYIAYKVYTRLEHKSQEEQKKEEAVSDAK